ncbi:MAG: hypothetical protein K0Q74_680 [Gammaproteobacteria bacterium]|nr:hypothetical protein [Gammaproteobacteria bacterium]
MILLLLISFEIKHKDFKQVTGSQNLEATYHTILTIKAFKSSPIENHWYLPTVTLGKNEDKYIPWGATVPTKTGDYIYTSFTSPGFLAPYLAFELFNLEPSEKSLAYFNFLLGSAVSLVLFIFLLKILEYSGYSRRVAVGGAVLGTVVSIFSKESLQSHGLVYWSQSFFQLILISALCFLFMYLVNKNNSKKYTICLIVSVFLGAWTEWSGYVFGVGLAALFWFGVLIERPKKILSLQLIATMVVAGLLTLLHYGLAVGFDPAIKAFIGRFLARNTASGNLIDLLDGYALSFGFFILITCAALIPSFFSIDSNQK